MGFWYDNDGNQGTWVQSEDDESIFVAVSDQSTSTDDSSTTIYEDWALEDGQNYVTGRAWMWSDSSREDGYFDLDVTSMTGQFTLNDYVTVGQF